MARYSLCKGGRAACGCRYYVAEEEKELISHLSTNIQEEHERK